MTETEIEKELLDSLILAIKKNENWLFTKDEIISWLRRQKRALWIR